LHSAFARTPVAAVLPVPPYTVLLPLTLIAVWLLSRSRRASRRSLPAVLGLAGAGLAKLLLLVLPLEQGVTDALAAAPLARSGWSVWCSALAYSAQLFLLLSGAADLLTAIALLGQKRLTCLLRAPFRADSFTGLWRRFCLPGRRLGSARRQAFAGLLLVAATALLWRGWAAPVLAWLALHALLIAAETARGGRSLFAGPVPPPLRAVGVAAVWALSAVLLLSADFAEAVAKLRLLAGQGQRTAYTLALDARIGGAWEITLLWAAWLSALLLASVRRPLHRRPGLLLGCGPLLGLVALVFGPTLAGQPARTAMASHAAEWKRTWWGEGDRDVLVGGDGWWFAAAELERLTRVPRAGRSEQLCAFLEMWHGQGTELLVVPVPSKLALQPEALLPAKFAGPLRAADLPSKLAALEAAGARVLDPAALLWEARRRQLPYFRQDRHWTPEAMKQTALAVASRVRREWPRVAADATPLVDARVLEREQVGDLAMALLGDLAEARLGVETASLVALSGLPADRESPVLVVGDGLRRVFDDPALGFGDPEGEPQGAGFTAQLAALLARSLDEADEREVLTDPTRAADKRLIVWLLPADAL
jgi:hypothetical protein